MASVINQATLPSGISIQPTDTVALQGSQLVVVRGGIEVYRINLRPISAPLATSFSFGTLGNVNTIFWGQRMAGINVCNTAVTENQTTGVVVFQWSDGSSDEVANWQDLADIADQIDADTTWLKKFLKARAYRVSPGGEDKRTQVGAQAGANLVAAEPITYTPAV